MDLRKKILLFLLICGMSYYLGWLVGYFESTLFSR